MSDNSPMALSVEKVRHEMLRGILIPREMVNEALATTYAKLKAQETKFFTFKGRVTEKREVDAHGIQLEAADKIFSLAGLYAREREATPTAPGVALEVDPTTGVVRIIVGATAPLAVLEEAPKTIELPPAEPSPAEALVSVTKNNDTNAPMVTKRRAAVPESAWRILTDEIVE